MNARELHDRLEYEHKAGLRWLFSSDSKERETILRALRLLAAAEANNGIRAALEQVKRMESIGRPLSGEEQTVVRIINGLAARVAELEDKLNCTEMDRDHARLDAARSKP